MFDKLSLRLAQGRPEVVPIAALLSLRLLLPSTYSLISFAVCRTAAALSLVIKKAT